jgi:hypothetical protein
MESKFTDLYNKLLKPEVIQEGTDNPDLQNYNGLPEPFTEVKFRKDAMNHPFLKTKDAAFRDKVLKYIKEADSPDRKYRLMISSVNAIRGNLELADQQSGPIGHIAQIVEQEGAATRGHFTVPLELLEFKNAAWNQMQAPIPDGWRYDRFKHTKFADIFDAYNKGKQPPGTVTTGGNN